MYSLVSHLFPVYMHYQCDSNFTQAEFVAAAQKQTHAQIKGESQIVHD